MDRDDNMISEHEFNLNHRILQMNREDTQRKWKEAEHALEEVRRSPEE